MKNKVLVLLVFVTLSSNGFAWGHFKINDLKKTIVYPLLKDKEIKYCIDITKSVEQDFPYESIDTQIKTALKVWLESLNSYDRTLNIGTIKLTNIECSKLDTTSLKIKVKTADRNDMGALYYSNYSDAGESTPNIYMLEPGPTISIVKNSPAFAVVDIKNMIGKEEQFSTVLENAWKFKLSDINFAFERDLNQVDVSHSYYVKLLHEVGHVMGLCDLYPGGINNCDEKNTNGAFPSDSLMNSSDYFYPTKDDLQGVVTLIKRYYEKFPELKKEDQEKQKPALYNGEYKELYSDGKVKLITNYKNGDVDGAYTYFYPNGSIKVLAEYKDGERIQYKAYSETGGIVKEKYYNGDNFTSRAFYESGNEKSCGEQDQDGLQLNYTSYYNNGVSELRILFKQNGEPASRTINYENGKLEKTDLYGVNKTPSGLELNSKIHLIEKTEYYENGNKKKQTVADYSGSIEFASVDYDLNGKEIKRIEKNSDQNICIYRTYDENGVIVPKISTQNGPTIMTYEIDPEGWVQKYTVEVTLYDYPEYFEFSFHKNGNTKSMTSSSKKGAPPEKTITYYENGKTEYRKMIISDHKDQQCEDCTEETWYSENCKDEEQDPAGNCPIKKEIIKDSKGAIISEQEF